MCQVGRDGGIGTQQSLGMLSTLNNGKRKLLARLRLEQRKKVNKEWGHGGKDWSHRYHDGRLAFSALFFLLMQVLPKEGFFLKFCSTPASKVSL